mgnify:CR=1 FL=1
MFIYEQGFMMFELINKYSKNYELSDRHLIVVGLLSDIGREICMELWKVLLN